MSKKNIYPKTVLCKNYIKVLNFVLTCLLICLLFESSKVMAVSSNLDGQGLLRALAGNWQSVRGYVENDLTTTCYTPQMFYLVESGQDAANFSYSVSCTNGFQVQMQGLDFRPSLGTYKNGYNSVSSRYVYNNSNLIGFERKMTTTWGFGSMINFQYQTVRVVVTKMSLNGEPLSLDLQIINSQSNVQNGQSTIYHLELTKY